MLIIACELLDSWETRDPLIEQRQSREEPPRWLIRSLFLEDVTSSVSEGMNEMMWLLSISLNRSIQLINNFTKRTNHLVLMV
jgi:hypothetical protein